MEFENIKARIEEILKSYDRIEILKYESAEENNGAFLVRYKHDDIDEDLFTYDIWFDCEDIDFVDCNGYGFASIRTIASYEEIKKMFDLTFSDESVEYNIKAYYEEV